MINTYPWVLCFSNTMQDHFGDYYHWIPDRIWKSIYWLLIYFSHYSRFKRPNIFECFQQTCTFMWLVSNAILELYAYKNLPQKQEWNLGVSWVGCLQIHKHTLACRQVGTTLLLSLWPHQCPMLLLLDLNKVRWYSLNYLHNSNRQVFTTWSKTNSKMHWCDVMWCTVVSNKSFNLSWWIVQLLSPEITMVKVLLF